MFATLRKNFVVLCGETRRPGILNESLHGKKRWYGYCPRISGRVTEPLKSKMKIVPKRGQPGDQLDGIAFQNRCFGMKAIPDVDGAFCEVCRGSNGLIVLVSFPMTFPLQRKKMSKHPCCKILEEVTPHYECQTVAEAVAVEYLANSLPAFPAIHAELLQQDIKIGLGM